MQDISLTGTRRAIRLVESVAELFFNAIPLIGVLFWQWSPFAVVFLYWLENVAIGGRTVLSILTLTGIRGSSIGAGVAAATFFLLHYGIFCLVHGLFVVALFGDVDAQNATGLFSLTDVTSNLLSAQNNLAIGFASIVLWQIAEFLFFLIRSRAPDQSVSGLMKAPYLRIGILHVTILFGGFVMMLLGWPPIGVLFLVVFKTWYDWHWSRRAERPEQEDAQAA